MLFLIPARGGSKRLPGKNLKELAGIPLVAHAIRRARGAARILGGEHRVVVSTDSEDIARVAREWGAEVLMRPPELATDEASASGVVMHAAQSLDVDEVLYVQPTSPLATAEDLAETARLYLHEDRPMGAMARTAGRANGAAYAVCGQAPYWGGLAHEMPRSRAVDIDTEDDFRMAEALLAARPVAPFAIGGRAIGPGQPTFVVAEIGVNHNGDTATAHKLIDAAADAGADAVKFQAFIPEFLAEPGPHLDMLRGLVLDYRDWEPLHEHAERRGLAFLSSVFDIDSVEMHGDFWPAYKVPSGEIVNLPLLRHVASKGKPAILSTGMATMVEIARAVDALAGVPLALLHCISEYPTNPRTANLRAIQTLRQAFGVPVGWSDHTIARLPSALAVALGACIAEKHLTLNAAQKGPDHASSAEPEDFARMVRGIRIAEDALGNGVKVPTEGELRTAAVARRRDGLRRSA